MKKNRWIRRAIYVLAIFALVLPLRWLGFPTTPTYEGGKLAVLQREHGLAQTSLGEIDPASETMKLVTLGFRGLASQLLWNQAIEAKKEENWSQLTATLKQLSRLQPNFITFWKFQSWNISYNVSVQFDDYRDRYFYVREGIKFLEQGIEHNRENDEIPQLLWDKGWFLGQKIGRADEYVQYRRLFKEDDEYHGDRVLGERDNWLVSKEAYLDAVDSIDNRHKSLGKKSPKIFYSSPAKSQMSYAEAIEEEGEFVQGQQAWVTSEDDWVKFGDLKIEHSTGVWLQLGREAQVAEDIERLQQQLEELMPGVRDELKERKREQLSDIERESLDTPESDRTPQQADTAYQSRGKLEVFDRDVAAEIAERDPEKRIKAYDLATRLEDLRILQIYTQRYKSDANYDYWLVRSQFEQTPEAVAAREKMFEGKQAFARGERNEARELYEAGFVKWREVLDAFPVLMDQDGPTGEDILYFIEDYRKVLNALDETFPEDFPLWDIMENFDLEQKFIEEVQEHRRSMEADGESGEENGNTAENPAEEPGETTDTAGDPDNAEPDAAEPDTAEPAESEPSDTAPSDTAPAESGEESPPEESEPAATGDEQPATDEANPAPNDAPSETNDGQR